MIQEITIIHLQAIASFLMGYEYFFSEKNRVWMENELKIVVMDIQSDADKRIKFQNKLFLESLPPLIIGILSVALYYGSLAVIDALSQSGGNRYLILVVGLIGLLSIFGFIKLIEGFLKGVMPYSIPVFIGVIATFLLYCPKGVIGGIGMLFLAASFVCRYINITA